MHATSTHTNVTGGEKRFLNTLASFSARHSTQLLHEDLRHEFNASPDRPYLKSTMASCAVQSMSGKAFRVSSNSVAVK
jgi:hypothetical protein